MAILLNSFDGGTNAVTITTGNSGGASGNAFNLVSALPFSNGQTIHTSAMAAGVINPGTALRFAAWTGPAVGVLRWYVYVVSANPTSATNIGCFTYGGGTQGVIAQLNASGQMSLVTKGAVTRATNTGATFPVNQWVRIELYGLAGTSTTTGAARLAYYLGDSTTLVWDSGLFTGIDTAGTAATFDFALAGKYTGNSHTGTYYVDDMGLKTSTDAVWGAWPSLVTPVDATVNAVVATVSAQAVVSEPSLSSDIEAVAATVVSSALVPVVTGVNTPVLTALGSLTLSGSSLLSVKYTTTADGSLTLSGSASQLTKLILTASGALTLSGSGTSTAVLSRTALGSLTLSGTAVQLTKITLTATGGLTLAGTASQVTAVTRTATGGMALTGSAVNSIVAILSAVGNLTLSGTADANTGGGALTRTASGTLTLAGAATSLVVLTRSGIGTLTLTGTAGLSGGQVVRTALGSLTLSASSVAVLRYVLTANGILNISGSATATAVESSVTRTANGNLTLTASAVTGIRLYLTATGALTLLGQAILSTGQLVPEYRTLRVLSSRRVLYSLRRTITERKP